MATAAQVQAMRTGYDEIERLIRRDLRKLWPRLRRSTPDTIRNVLLNMAPMLSDQYGAVATAMAAEWFEMVTGQTAHLAELTVPEAVEASVRYKAGGLYRDRQEQALEGVTASLVRHALQPARSTVALSSSRARLRYARSPRPGACAWCLMLASRGAVYTKQTAKYASDGDRYHDDCYCVPEPARDDSELSYDVAALYSKYSDAFQSGDNDAVVAAKMRELYGLA